MNCAISEISVGERKRRLNAERVSELAKSIAEIGLLNPVTVTEGNRLVAGLHRLEACRSLGWKAVPVTLAALSGLNTELAEIDENLIRNELTVLERGEHLARRKEIYEALHPETRNGYGPGRGRTEKQRHSVVAFTEDAAAKIGVSPRTVEREVKIATDLAPDVKESIRETPTADSKTELLELARKPEPEQRQIAEKLKSGEARKVSDAVRQIARAETRELAAATVLPTGKYRCIVIDPPWEGADTGDDDPIGKGDPRYVTMGIEEIAALPVGDLAEDGDCHLYLWVTNRTLPLAFSLLEKWGFRYLTTLTWCKPALGVGRYYRNNTEHVLFAAKGTRLLGRADVGTWFEAPREGRHSTKPQAFFELIESCSPGPRLEMFARQDREGWATWGAEA